MALRNVGAGGAGRAVSYKELERIGVDPRKPIDNPNEVLQKLGKGGETATQGGSASPKFTPDELVGMNSTIAKLKGAPKDIREKQIDQMRKTLQSQLADFKNAESDALKRQAEFSKRNPTVPPEENFFNTTVEKAQARVKKAKHDWNKFAFVVNQVHGK